jgi:hypothetical protein
MGSKGLLITDRRGEPYHACEHIGPDDDFTAGQCKGDDMVAPTPLSGLVFKDHASGSMSVFAKHNTPAGSSRITGDMPATADMYVDSAICGFDGIGPKRSPTSYSLSLLPALLNGALQKMYSPELEAAMPRSQWFHPVTGEVMDNSDGAVEFKSCTLGDAGTKEGAGAMRFTDNWRTATYYKGPLNHADTIGRHGDFCCGKDTYLNAAGKTVELWEDEFKDNDDCMICKDWAMTAQDWQVQEQTADDECGGCDTSKAGHQCIPAHNDSFGSRGVLVPAKCKCVNHDWHGKHCEFAPLEWSENMDPTLRRKDGTRPPTDEATSARITCRHVERTDTCPMRFLTRMSRRNDIKLTRGVNKEVRQAWCDANDGGKRQFCPMNNGGCHKDALCKQATYSAHTICTCKTGYTGNGRTACAIYDMCGVDTQNGGCGTHSTCTNVRDAGGKPTGASPTCQCQTGYTDHVPVSKKDKDGKRHRTDSNCRRLCSEQNGGCSQNATCEQDRPGLTACKCPYGYEGMGIGSQGCKLTDFCLAGLHSCHADADCKMTSTVKAGLHSCTCKAGFSGDGFQCNPIDVCADKNDECSEHAVCKSWKRGLLYS